jgi:hypothetical protein
MSIVRKVFAGFLIGAGISFFAVSIRIVLLVILEHPPKSELFLLAISVVLDFVGFLCCQRGFRLWKSWK